ncbi:transposase [Streptomyces sp. NBC_01221]|nr:transposase [Streptomyces sp. NBC_01221]MCX4793944.1 transposase [Streptomyces sp. NBC_01242]
MTVEGDPVEEALRAERRRIRRRHKARLKVAALGRSRGGLTVKTHLATDRRCRPLSFVVTPGQAADSPRFAAVLDRVRIRGPVGRPRTRPGAVAADKAYSSRANRSYLRKRRIQAVIPEKKDQAAHRKKRGSKGGRPSPTTPSFTRRGTPSSAASTRSRNGEGWPPATTRLLPATSPDSTYADRSSGSGVSAPRDPNLEHALADG